MKDELFYTYVHLEGKDPSWRGVRIVKMPIDLLLYSEVIWENQPDFIIDSGTKFGGSALFFQDMLDLIGKKGRVITIDKFPVRKKKDPRITYIEDGSTSESTLKTIKKMVGKKKVMVVLDSNHSRQHVKRELYYYSKIVTPGQYMVVEDCHARDGSLFGPGEARDWFLRINKNFIQTNLDYRFMVGLCRDRESYRYLAGLCRGGWLRRK